MLLLLPKMVLRISLIPPIWAGLEAQVSCCVSESSRYLLHCLLEDSNS